MDEDNEREEVQEVFEILVNDSKSNENIEVMLVLTDLFSEN